MKQLNRMEVSHMIEDEISSFLSFLGDKVQTDRERLAIEQGAKHVTIRVLDRLGSFAAADKVENERRSRQVAKNDKRHRKICNQLGLPN